MRGQDLNLRPSGYEPDELPDCSTPRLMSAILLANGWQSTNSFSESMACREKRLRAETTKAIPENGLFEIWLRGQDLNLRPSGYEPDELPDCSTPRLWLAILRKSAAVSSAILKNVRRIKQLCARAERLAATRPRPARPPECCALCWRQALHWRSACIVPESGLCRPAPCARSSTLTATASSPPSRCATTRVWPAGRWRWAVRRTAAG
ncbi:hypothetical protein OF001_U140007 [Pseudomonas sp. OF001]|nr:hypothetical protein OF001_U140007 [Pseudomonas sp. OF001]